MTYTIVAVERATGHVGVATASHSVNLLPKTISIGAEDDRLVVVASQSFSNRALGEQCVADILAGVDVHDAAARALAGDTGRQLRQLAMAVSDGSVLAYTGSRCVPVTGQHVDDVAGFAVAGNMLADRSVIPAMTDAFLASAGADLPDRLLRALAAGSAAGGDFRGDRSAGLFVHTGTTTVDLRTDDSSTPVAHVQHLYRLRADTAVLADCYAWYAAGCPAEQAAALLARLEADSVRAVDDDLAAWAEIVRRLGRLTGSVRADLAPPARRLVHALAGAPVVERTTNPDRDREDARAR